MYYRVRAYMGQFMRAIYISSYSHYKYAWFNLFSLLIFKTIKIKCDILQNIRVKQGYLLSLGLHQYTTYSRIKCWGKGSYMYMVIWIYFSGAFLIFILREKASLHKAFISVDFVPPIF